MVGTCIHISKLYITVDVLIEQNKIKQNNTIGIGRKKIYVNVYTVFMFICIYLCINMSSRS